MQGRLSAVMVTSHDHQHKAQSFSVMCFFFFLQLFKNVHTARCLHFVCFNVVEATHASCMYVTVIHWKTILLPVQLQCTRMNMFAEQVKPVNGESHGWTPKVKYWIPRKEHYFVFYLQRVIELLVFRRKERKCTAEFVNNLLKKHSLFSQNGISCSCVL